MYKNPETRAYDFTNTTEDGVYVYVFSHVSRTLNGPIGDKNYGTLESPGPLVNYFNYAKTRYSFSPELPSADWTVGQFEAYLDKNKTEAYTGYNVPIANFPYQTPIKGLPSDAFGFVLKYDLAPGQAANMPLSRAKFGNEGAYVCAQVDGKYFVVVGITEHAFSPAKNIVPLFNLVVSHARTMENQLPTPQPLLEQAYRGERLSQHRVDSMKHIENLALLLGKSTRSIELSTISHRLRKINVINVRLC